MKRAVALVLAVTLALPTAVAAPRKILVLQLEGSADATTRERFSASVQRVARVLDGQIQHGDTTFADTAAAVGCDPAVPSCANDVRAILGVDELVFGTLTTTTPDRMTLVVKRVDGSPPPREITMTLAASDPPERAEPTLLGLFSPAPPPGPAPDLGAGVVTSAGTGAEPIDQPRGSRRDRNFGIASVAGGGTMFLIGLSLWSSASGLQDDIDAAATDDYNDFTRLIELEDKASSRAWAGNLLVLGGLALGGYGVWLLYKDRKARRAMVMPAPIENGAAVTFTYIGDGW